MSGALFTKGLVFGFILAAAVGPMWLLCFRRTIASGALMGLVSGMGIATADGIYGAIAAFGLTAVSGFLLGHSLWIGLLGAAFLIYLGIKSLAAKPMDLRDEKVDRTGLARAFFSTLGLTLTNPPTILAFAAIFAGLGLVSTADYAAAAWIVLGVFLGSAAWWTILAAGAGRLRGRLGPRLARGINVASGISILGFALWQLVELFR
jgi:threonine/homoserine/homoserine lactone efflux protein